MAGRPKIYTDEELIDKATQVFWQKGYEGANAKQLMEAMDIGQGSFYRSFPGGKKELYQKTLTRFLEKTNKQFHQELEESQDPVQFIKDFFYAIPKRSTLEKSNGCYFGNALVESSNLDEETRILSANLLTKLKDGFEKALKKAQKLGKFDANKSPETMAVFLINLWNGINVTQRMYPEEGQVELILKMNLQMLD